MTRVNKAMVVLAVAVSAVVVEKKIISQKSMMWQLNDQLFTKIHSAWMDSSFSLLLGTRSETQRKPEK